MQESQKKRILVLGSTGTIGLNTLQIIRRFSDRFEVAGLTAYRNSALLQKQIEEFLPDYVGVPRDAFTSLTQPAKPFTLFDADTQLGELAGLPDIDVVVLAISGSAALEPFLAAVRAGKRVAPANKEALVVAGDILMAEAKRCNATIIPVDSEQSAIFQCLEGHNRSELKKVYLTASGGPLRNVDVEKFDTVSVEDILAHPRWKMGRKITVDSATLMNKGFEVIEAQRLFGLETDEIEIVVHPEAVIHSMACFCDGSIIAQLGETDMQIPIQYALTYPQRRPTDVKDLDLFALEKMHFEKPDVKRFPALSLCLDVAKKGGTLPSVLNAADEEAVEAFLQGKMCFTKIYDVVSKVVRDHKNGDGLNLEEIVKADQWARQRVSSLIA